MSIEQTFKLLLKAEADNDGAAFDRIAEGSGYDPDALTTSYVEWTKTGAVAEPNPLKQVAQGAQLGFTDELVGFGSAAGKYLAGDKEFGKNYEARRDAERASSELYRASNPGRSAALNMAGGLAVPVPGGFVAKGATLPARMGRAAVLGVPYGGAAGLGFSEDETAGGMAIDAGVGATIGAVTGAVAVPVLEGATAGVRGVGRAISNRGKTAIPPAPALQQNEGLTPGSMDLPQVGPDAPVSVSASQSADEAIVRAMQRDGYTPQQIREVIAGRALDTTPLGSKPLTILDELPAGGATQRLARGARTNAPGAGGRADAMLAGRDRLQGRRIEDDGARLIGSRMDDPEVAMQQITAEARKAAKPFYDEVRAAGEVDMRTLEPYVNDSIFQKVMNEMRGIAKYRSMKANDAQFLDEMYKRLGAERQSLVKTGTSAARVGDVSEMMNGIKASLDVPTGGAYSKATSIYSDEIGPREALKEGLDVFKDSAAAVARKLREMPPAEADTYREAAMSAVRQRLRSMGYNRDAVKSIFNSDEMIDKFRAILGPEKFKQFEGAIANEAKAAATSQFIRGNSQTVDKAADAMNAGGMMDVVRGAMTDPQGAVTAAAGRAVVDRLGRLVPGAEARSDSIITRLLSPDTGDQLAWLNQLIDAQGRVQRQATTQGRLLQPVTGSAVVSTSGMRR